MPIILPLLTLSFNDGMIWINLKIDVRMLPWCVVFSNLLQEMIRVECRTLQVTGLNTSMTSYYR